MTQFPILPLWSVLSGKSASWNMVSGLPGTDIRSLPFFVCPHIWELHAFGHNFPVEITCNYVLHGFVDETVSRGLESDSPRSAHVRRNALRICSQTIVMNLICWLIQWLHLPLKQTVRQTEARTALRSCSPSSPVMGGSPLLALRERLCGCSHVYVWEISNDERMPFQVWTRGASVQCPTLTPYARTHMLPRRHTHSCVRLCVYVYTHL